MLCCTQAMAKKHEEGQSQQNASHTLVAPNGAQLEEVLGMMKARKVKLEVYKVSRADSCLTRTFNHSTISACLVKCVVYSGGVALVRLLSAAQCVTAGQSSSRHVCGLG